MMPSTQPLPAHWQRHVDVLIQPCMHTILMLHHRNAELGEMTHETIIAMQQRLLAQLQELPNAARSMGFSQDDAHAIQYALAAFADESAMGHSMAVAQVWVLDLLQMQLFGTHCAGHEFYTRLHGLLTQKVHIAPLWVFYVCLIFGFQGRYGLHAVQNIAHAQHGPQTREQWIHTTWHMLCEHGALLGMDLAPAPSTLAHHSVAPQPTTLRRWMPLALGAWVLFASIAIICMRLIAQHETHDVLTWWSQMNTQGVGP